MKAAAKTLLMSLGIAALTHASSVVTPSEVQPQAWVKEIGGEAQLFDYYEVVESSPDKMITRTRFVDRETKEDAFREIVTTDLEGRLMYSYEIEHLQLDEKGSIQVDRATKKISYRYYKEGSWRENSEDLEEPFLVGAMIPRFIRLNETEIQKDDKIRFHLAVPYMAKSFNFALRKDEMVDFEGRSMLSVEMLPTHFLVRAAVKPLYFTYDLQTSDVRRILGKVFLKKRTKSGYESFMAETLFLKEIKVAPAPASSNRN